MIPKAIDEKDFRYELSPDEELAKQKKKFVENINQVIKKLQISDYCVELNYSLLGSILVRVDERRDYYEYFHSDKDQIMRISRGKEVALNAYWLIKYKPLRIKGIEAEERFYEEFRCSFNEIFAAMLIISFVEEVSDCCDGLFTNGKIKTLIYDLYNRDISKEAMIMYVESFLKEASIV